MSQHVTDCSPWKQGSWDCGLCEEPTSVDEQDVSMYESNLIYMLCNVELKCKPIDAIVAKINLWKSATACEQTGLIKGRLKW